jgi:hypothetical protein
MDIIQAHKFCTHNKESISKSKNCGCFYCLEIFPANEVTEFMENENTAYCPKCMIDSVICDYEIKFDKQFLLKMNKYWFKSYIA